MVSWLEELDRREEVAELRDPFDELARRLAEREDVLSRLQITRETMTEILSGDETVTVAGAEADAGEAEMEEHRLPAGSPVGVRLVPHWTPELAVGVLPGSYRDIVEVHRRGPGGRDRRRHQVHRPRATVLLGRTDPAPPGVGLQGPPGPDHQTRLSAAALGVRGSDPAQQPRHPNTLPEGPHHRTPWHQGTQCGQERGGPASCSPWSTTRCTTPRALPGADRPVCRPEPGRHVIGKGLAPAQTARPSH